jgi:hypothetical protein
MKRCPTCDLLYEFQSLRFCRFDGSPLNNTTWRDAPTMLLGPDHDLDAEYDDTLSHDVQDYSGFTGLDM